MQAAIRSYRTRRLAVEKGNKARSMDTTEDRLENFFRPVLQGRLASLTAERVKTLYLGRYSDTGDLVEHGAVTRPTRFNKPASAATHRNELGAAKTFLSWCVEVALISKDPGAAVKKVGKPNSGKKQLSQDQSNLWLDKASQFALEGDMGAVAALVAFVIALRASEIVGLTREQVDADGTVVIVWRGKSKRAERRLAVPVETAIGRILRLCMKSLCTDKVAADTLFGRRDRSWVLQNVKRICRAAGVPEVSAHGLRGTHATLAEEAGTTPAMMLQSLGHESRGVQHRAYIEPGATERARARKAMGKMKVLRGGADDAAPIKWRQRGARVPG